MPVDLCTSINAKAEVLPEILCVAATRDKICAAVVAPGSEGDPSSIIHQYRHPTGTTGIGNRCRPVTMQPNMGET